jgi:hypothetical protein
MASSSSELPSPCAVPSRSYSELEEAAFKELDNLSLKEILDQDSRPTFVIDLDPDYIVGHTIRPIFCNAALRQHTQLLDSITGAAVQNDDADVHDVEGQAGATYHKEFVDWATGISKLDDSKDIFPLSLQHRDLLWTGSTIRSRWRIISGNALFQTSDIPKEALDSASSTKSRQLRHKTQQQIPYRQPLTAAETQPISTSLGGTQQSETASASPSKNTSKDTSGSRSSVTLGSPEYSVPDWTAPSPRGIISEHVKFARNYDWASTPLGPLEKWSPQFREVVNLLMRNPHPASLFWGEDLTMLYNEAYKIEVAGNKHPDLMGTGMENSPSLQISGTY